MFETDRPTPHGYVHLEDYISMQNRCRKLENALAKILNECGEDTEAIETCCIIAEIANEALA